MAKQIELLTTIQGYGLTNPKIYGEKGEILTVTRDQGSRYMVRGKKEIFPVSKNQCKAVK